MAILKPDPISVSIEVGVDLGKVNDPTAICVAEVQLRDYKLRDYGRRREGGVYHYVARHLERLPLGTPYPAVVNRLVEINVRLLGERREPRYWVDATGVGSPVVDLLRDARLPVTPVYLTGTDKAAWEGGELRLGKAVMVSRLQVLLQQARIHLPKTREADALVQELLNYEIKVSDDAHAQFGAFRTGQHDDLATALGLACWEEPGSRGFGWGYLACLSDRR